MSQLSGDLKEKTGFSLDEVDRRLIRLSQEGLALTAHPYRDLAERAGLEENEVLSRFKKLLEVGAIRRVAAVPNHYRIGYKANGMTVWDVEDTRVDEMGERVGALEIVSHCYRRPRHAEVWPYNLFAMVHGSSREEVLEKAKVIQTLLGSTCRSHDILFSKRILKKTGFRMGE